MSVTFVKCRPPQGWKTRSKRVKRDLQRRTERSLAVRTLSDACCVDIETGVDWRGFHTPCLVCCFRHPHDFSDLSAFGHILNYSVSPNYIFQDRKGEEFMQKMWAPGNQRVPKSPGFLEEDDWLLLTSPKGQTAHQDLSPFSAKMFFLSRWFVINAHAVLSDTPFTGWGTATCFNSAALHANRLAIVKASAHHGADTHANLGGAECFVPMLWDTGGLVTD